MLLVRPRTPRGIAIPPLGLGYLASALRSAHEVTPCEGLPAPEEVLDLEGGYDAVCITIWSDGRPQPAGWATRPGSCDSAPHPCSAGGLLLQQPASAAVIGPVTGPDQRKQKEVSAPAALASTVKSHSRAALIPKRRTLLGKPWPLARKRS